MKILIMIALMISCSNNLNNAALPKSREFKIIASGRLFLRLDNESIIKNDSITLIIIESFNFTLTNTNNSGLIYYYSNDKRLKIDATNNGNLEIKYYYDYNLNKLVNR